MMHVLSCGRVRDDLEAYHDGELSIEERVLIQGHLKECVACRLEANSLDDLGDALRTMAGATPGRSATETDRLTTGVLHRVHVEDQLSLRTWVGSLFEDMHLVWAGLGATAAVLICVAASAGVLQAASRERPDSLKGLITIIANADLNDPVRLSASALNNAELLARTTAIQESTETDAEVMFSALVTRDGRIQNLEVLKEQARVALIRPELVAAMANALAEVRFERLRADSQNESVKVVWLMTSTMVKGRPDYDLYLVTPPRWLPPTNGPTRPRRPTPAA